MTSHDRFRLGVASAAFALSVTALSAIAPVSAAPSYDGLWSVLIVTEKGTCDRAYRYPVRISNGSLVNAGDSPINISGKVVGNGSVTVNVAYRDKAAAGTGRLSSTGGGGTWRGGDCAGTWEAERRG